LPPPTVTEEMIYGLELVVNEAGSNIMRHAYQGREDQKIRIVADAYDDRICFDLVYGGEPFDPDKVAPPAFDGSREGGFGVYMIVRSVDSVCYSRNERGENRIHLEKLHRRSEQAGGEKPHGVDG
jgi:anti-sigma regulatory factor (Ser/Thr protein kinase)